MIMEENKKVNIDLGNLMGLLWAKRRTFLKVWTITFILACIWILPQPRYFNCKVTLAPETSNGTSSLSGGISALASSFGFSLGNSSQDAIGPTLYPDIFESTEFMCSLFNIQIMTKDSSLHCNYYTYLSKHQKESWLTYPFKWTFEKISEIVGDNSDSESETGKKVNPFKLSKQENKIIKKMTGNINCSVDKKTDLISIIVEDQDPLVCAMLADSISEHLQDYIIKYRTHKIRIDLQHYQHLSDSAYAEYQKAIVRYSAFCDANVGMTTQRVNSKRDELENDMEMKQNAYMALFAQLNATKVKLQERTPAFTTLKNATVPLKPAGPKRMIFVGCMLFLATIVYATQLIRKNLKQIMF